MDAHMSNGSWFRLSEDGKLNQEQRSVVSAAVRDFKALAAKHPVSIENHIENKVTPTVGEIEALRRTLSDPNKAYVVVGFSNGAGQLVSLEREYHQI